MLYEYAENNLYGLHGYSIYIEVITSRDSYSFIIIDIYSTISIFVNS